jgi:hypothetical protein
MYNIIYMELGITSNIFLEEEAKRLKIPLIVVSKDELKQMSPKNGGYIINLQNSDRGSGTHWVGLYIYNKTAVYNDSFGGIPPVEVIKFCNKKLFNIVYNIDIIQNLKSDACGYFALFFLYAMDKYKTKDLRKVLIKFTNLFSKKNTTYNDELLKKYYLSL